MKHLAVIMDGNRRWAIKRGLRPWLGHQEGTKAVERIITFCLENKINFLSLYTFSIENLEQRNEFEKKYLLNLLVEVAKEKVGMFVEHGIRINFVGDKTLFPDAVQPTIVELEKATADGEHLQVNILFCYGSRQEIVAGAKKFAVAVKDDQINPDDISEKEFAEFLWSGSIPEPDLIIRTGGAQRLSNFLLFQAAYSELYFLDCLWPEISEDHLLDALDHFNSTQRNFGI
jgi:undecaprenyl diphosphate synthase